MQEKRSYLCVFLLALDAALPRLRMGAAYSHGGATRGFLHRQMCRSSRCFGELITNTTTKRLMIREAMLREAMLESTQAHSVMPRSG